MRKQLPSLRRGTFEMVYDKGGMSVFKRTYQEETTIIALNNTKKRRKKVHLTREQLDTNKELHGLMEEDIIRPAKDGYYLVLDRETANVYALAEKNRTEYSVYLCAGWHKCVVRDISHPCKKEKKEVLASKMV
ncbi:hypothetical protein GCM10020331_079260 [Ectobacillus funiculus]